MGTDVEFVKNAYQVNSALFKQRQFNNDLFFNLRKYQEEIFESAKDENSICLLNTSSGKTMIAVHIMKYQQWM